MACSYCYVTYFVDYVEKKLASRARRAAKEGGEAAKEVWIKRKFLESVMGRPPDGCCESGDKVELGLASLLKSLLLGAIISYSFSF